MSNEIDAINDFIKICKISIVFVLLHTDCHITLHNLTLNLCQIKCDTKLVHRITVSSLKWANAYACKCFHLTLINLHFTVVCPLFLWLDEHCFYAQHAYATHWKFGYLILQFILPCDVPVLSVCYFNQNHKITLTFMDADTYTDIAIKC